MTVVILKKFLTQYELDTSGRKADLVERLAAHIETLKGDTPEEAAAETASTEETETETPAASTVRPQIKLGETRYKCFPINVI